MSTKALQSSLCIFALMFDPIGVKPLLLIDVVLQSPTPEVEKSNFYRDLEGVLDWEESDIKNENQNENDEKQKRE